MQKETVSFAWIYGREVQTACNTPVTMARENIVTWTLIATFVTDVGLHRPFFLWYPFKHIAWVIPFLTVPFNTGNLGFSWGLWMPAIIPDAFLVSKHSWKANLHILILGNRLYRANAMVQSVLCLSLPEKSNDFVHRHHLIFVNATVVWLWICPLCQQSYQITHLGSPRWLETAVAA